MDDTYGSYGRRESVGTFINIIISCESKSFIGRKEASVKVAINDEPKLFLDLLPELNRV